MVEESLKNKVPTAVMWTFFEAIGTSMIRFIIGVILARLLMPEQFGLIGMLMIFIAIADALLNGGFISALVQKKEITGEDTSSVFYLNIIIGLFISGVFFASSTSIASFYNQPSLASLVKALSLVIIINSFGIVQIALLNRNIDFKTQTKISLIAGSCSGIIAITAAFYGFGVWSLVIQRILDALLKTALLWLLNTWRPSMVFSMAAIREMFDFGSRILVSRLINEAFENAYFVVIGKLFSPFSLGLYARAKSMQDLVTGTLFPMVSRVSFPVFSSIQDDKVRIRSGLHKALCLLIFISSPIMLGLAIVAEPLVRMLLTEKWVPCVPFLQALCVLGLVMQLHMLNLGVIMAIGRSDLFLRLEIINRILTVCNIAITWQWGIMAMIIGQIVASVVVYILNGIYIGRLIHYTILDQLNDIYPTVICSALMGGVLYLVSFISFTNNISLLLSQSILGFIIYCALCSALRIPAFSDSINICRNLFSSSKQCI